MRRIIYRNAYKKLLTVSKKNRGQILDLFFKLDDAVAQSRTFELEKAILEVEGQETSATDMQKGMHCSLAYPLPIPLPEPGGEPLSEARVKIMIDNIVEINQQVDNRMRIKNYGLLGIAAVFYISCLVCYFANCRKVVNFNLFQIRKISIVQACQYKPVSTYSL